MFSDFDFIVKHEHISEISHILSNTLNLNSYIISSELIEEKDKVNIENEKNWETKIYKTLECWIKRKGRGAFFSDLIKIVGVHSTIAQEDLWENFDVIKNSNKEVNNKRNDQILTWNVPSKKYHFERKSPQDKLVKKFSNPLGSDTKMAACTGMGGVGKSSLALQFCWAQESKFSRIFWVESTSRKMLLDQYAQLFEELDLIPFSFTRLLYSREKIGKIVKKWFEKQKNWLIIFDNVPDHDETRDLIPTRGGSAILTSRSADWPNEIIQIPVDIFTHEESISFIKKFLKNPYNKHELLEIDIISLANLSQNLPISLVQACSLINKCHLSLRSYIEAYELRKKYLLEKKILQIDYNQRFTSVFVTWDLSMEKISRESELALACLEGISFLEGTRVPIKTLRILSKWKYKNEWFDEALGILANYSIVRLDGNFCTVHPIIQEVTRLKCSWVHRIKNIVSSYCLLSHSYEDFGGIEGEDAEKSIKEMELKFARQVDKNILTGSQIYQFISGALFMILAYQFPFKFRISHHAKIFSFMLLYFCSLVVLSVFIFHFGVFLIIEIFAYFVICDDAREGLCYWTMAYYGDFFMWWSFYFIITGTIFYYWWYLKPKSSLKSFYCLVGFIIVSAFFILTWHFEEFESIRQIKKLKND